MGESSYQKSNKLHIVAASAVIRREDGRCLVVKRGEHEVAHPGEWAFPGGKVEDNQTIEAALVKEVREEVGLTMRPGKTLLKDASFVRPDGQTVKVLCFLVSVEPGEVVLDARDFTEYRWVNSTELAELPHVGIATELEQAERIVALDPAVQQVIQSPSQRDE